MRSQKMINKYKIINIYYNADLLLKKHSLLSILSCVELYKAVELTTLLYGAESWVMYRHHLRLLERFHQRCLRTILNIRWSDFIANTEVLELAEVISIKAMVLKVQLRWSW